MGSAEVPRLDTISLADEKSGNPYLRIAANAGIFRRHGIDLKIRDIETASPRVLSKILTSDTQVANIQLDALAKNQVLGNIRMISYSTGIYATVFSLTRAIANLRDLSGKTLATADLSDAQLNTIKDRVRKELPSGFAAVTIVNARNSQPSELSEIFRKNDAQAFLLHSGTVGPVAPEYKYVTNIKQPNSAIFVKDEFLKKTSQVAERFLVSHVESIEYFRANRATVILDLMTRSPDLTISEAMRKYETLLRELPVNSADLQPSTADIKLFAQETLPAKQRLEATIEPTMMKSITTQGSKASSK
jgi:hypothetical protein